jgi:hypothetical protein
LSIIETCKTIKVPEQKKQYVLKKLAEKWGIASPDRADTFFTQRQQSSKARCPASLQQSAMSSILKTWSLCVKVLRGRRYRVKTFFTQREQSSKE